MSSRSLKSNKQRGVKRGREVKSTPPLRHTNSVSSPCNSRRLDQETRGRACEEAGRRFWLLHSSTTSGEKKGGEPGQRLTLTLWKRSLWVSRISSSVCFMRPTSALQRSMIWVRGAELPTPTAFLPFLLYVPPLHLLWPQHPHAHLADSTQGLLGILLAA